MHNSVFTGYMSKYRQIPTAQVMTSFFGLVYTLSCMPPASTLGSIGSRGRTEFNGTACGGVGGIVQRARGPLLMTSPCTMATPGARSIFSMRGSGTGEKEVVSCLEANVLECLNFAVSNTLAAAGCITLTLGVTLLAGSLFVGTAAIL